MKNNWVTVLCLLAVASILFGIWGRAITPNAPSIGYILVIVCMTSAFIINLVKIRKSKR